MRLEVTYFPPKQFCSMCRRKRDAKHFALPDGRAIPICKQCHYNFQYYVIAGEP
jgi:uncharacterized OB-fold protein